MLSDRFKTMYRQMGLNRLQAAQLLHVSERTLHNWETARHEIPYSAYKLLRLLSYSELPGKAWEGWHIAVGQLWSPEGYGFKPGDAEWWSALCRRSELFHVLYKENQQLKQALTHAAKERARLAGPLFAAANSQRDLGEVAVTLHLSPKNGTKSPFCYTSVTSAGASAGPKIPSYETANCPSAARLMRVQYSQNLFKRGAL